jgi:hypothetical protein
MEKVHAIAAAGACISIRASLLIESDQLLFLLQQKSRDAIKG